MAESGSFLQRWIRAMGATALLGGAFATAAYFFFAPKSDLEGLASVIPAAASSGVFVRGLDRWEPQLVDLLAGAKGTAESRAAVASLRTDTAKKAGFDVTDPEGWKQAGFEPDGTWGAVSLGADPEHAQVYALFPVRDAKLAQATMQRWLTAEGAKLEDRSDRGRTISVVTWSGADSAQGKPGAFTQIGGYVVVCDASGSTLDAPSSLEALVAAQGQPSLRDAPAFRAVRGELGERWAVMLYSSPEVVQSVTKGAHLDSSPLLKGLGTRGGGAVVELSATEVTLRVRLLNDPVQPTIPGLGPPSPNGLLTLGGDALAVARISLNLSALDDVIDHDERSKVDRDRTRASLKERYGVDLVTEVLHNLDGQFAAAVLMPAQVGASTPDAVATVGVKDVNLAADALDRLAAALRSQALPFAWLTSGVGERWTDAFGFAGGLAHAHLFAVWGPGREKLVHEGAVPGTLPMTHALPEAVKQAFADGPAIYAYVDVARLLAFSKGLVPPGSSDQAVQAMQGLKAVSFGLDAHRSVLAADLTLYAANGGWGPVDAGAP